MSCARYCNVMLGIYRRDLSPPPLQSTRSSRACILGQWHMLLCFTRNCTTAAFVLFVVPPRTESTRSEPRSNLGKNSWTKSMPVRAGFSPAALALDVYTLSLAVQTSVHAYGLAVVVHLTCMPDAGASRCESVLHKSLPPESLT